MRRGTPVAGLSVLIVLAALVPAGAANLAMVKIVSLETDDPPLVAQFNPKEILPDGTPCRATVNLVLKQAERVRARGGPAFTPTKCTTDAECPQGQTCQDGVCLVP